MALWARTRELTRRDVAAALYETRTLVRTSCMRQTLHLIPAADFSLYINALKRSRVEALWRILSKFGVAPREIEHLNEGVMAALQAGPKTQPELFEHLLPQIGKKMKAYVDLAWSIQLFRPALVEGLICYGPERNGRATFVRVDQWLPGQKAVPAVPAQQALLRRYLRAYGPATLQDFSKWSGISRAEVKTVHEQMVEELVEVRSEGESGLLLREDYERLITSRLADPVLRLLPSFDPYLLGHAKRVHLVSVDHYKRVYRSQGWLSPVVLLDGRVIGVWALRSRGKRTSVEIEPFEKVSKKIRVQVEAETVRLGHFLEMAGEIKFNLKHSDKSPSA